MSDADDYHRNFGSILAVQKACRELGVSLDEPPPAPDEVFDHYSEKITFAEMVKRFEQ